MAVLSRLVARHSDTSAVGADHDARAKATARESVEKKPSRAGVTRSLGQHFHRTLFLSAVHQIEWERKQQDCSNVDVKQRKLFKQSLFDKMQMHCKEGYGIVSIF